MSQASPIASATSVASQSTEPPYGFGDWGVSGSPVMPWISCAQARYRVLEGQPVEFSSSPPVRRTFCGACDTPLTYWNGKEPDSIDVTTCTLDHPEAFPPSHHSWVSHSIDWVKFGDGLPTFPKSRYGG